MFGIFDAVEEAVSNVIDVTIGAVSLGEYGDFSQRTVSKMVADGIEVYTIASFFDVGTDVIEGMLDD